MTVHKTTYRQRLRVGLAALSERLGGELPPVLKHYDPARPRPLKIGIRHELIKLLPLPVTDGDHQIVDNVMQMICRSESYLKALSEAGAMRHDLEGRPIEEVRVEQRVAAQAGMAALSASTVSESSQAQAGDSTAARNAKISGNVPAAAVSTGGGRDTRDRATAMPADTGNGCSTPSAGGEATSGQPSLADDAGMLANRDKPVLSIGRKRIDPPTE